MQNQVRHLYVGLDYPQHTSVEDLKGGANGDLAVLSATGEPVELGKKFQVLKKNNKGILLSSDIIDPKNILYSRAVAYKAPVLGSAVISDISVDINTLYTIEIAIKQFGSMSPEDEYVKKAFYKSKTGDDQEKIVDGLIKSLSRNFSREEPTTSATFTYAPSGGAFIELKDNSYFSFTKTGTGASATLTITEKTDWADNSFDPDRRTRTNLDFSVNAKFTTLPTVVSVNSAPAKLGGKQVAEMEFYLKGERNDIYRGAGYPHNFVGTYDADVNATYNAVEIGYFDEGRDEAKKSKKQLTIVMPFTTLASQVDINNLISDLKTVLGEDSMDVFPVA